MSAPAIVIDEKVVSTGNALNKKEIEDVLKNNVTFDESSCNCNSCK